MTTAPRPDMLDETRRGRSTVLDMGRVADLRVRPWVLRRLIVAGVLGVLAGLGWIVASEVLTPTGIGYLLYAAHDHLWLPLWSWLWMHDGYWSLLWFGPLAVISLMALTEFLGLGAPLRRLQVGALRFGLRHDWTRWLIGFQQMLGWKRGHEGLLVAVIDSELRREEVRAMVAIEADRSHDVTAFCRLAVGFTYLRASYPALLPSCAQQQFLVTMLDHDAGALLRSEQRRIWGDETADRIEKMTMIADEAIPMTVIGLSGPNPAPSDLALLTLGIVRRAVLSQPDAAAAWFTQWALQRYRIDVRRNDLTEAERLIDFEFWAAICERALAARSRTGWLPDLLPGVKMHRPLGELAAVALQPRPLPARKMEIRS